MIYTQACHMIYIHCQNMHSLIRVAELVDKVQFYRWRVHLAGVPYLVHPESGTDKIGPRVLCPLAARREMMTSLKWCFVVGLITVGVCHIGLGTAACALRTKWRFSCPSAQWDWR